MADTEAPGKKGNVLTRKIGPLPMWAWTSIVLIMVVGYSLYSNKKNAAAAAAAPATGTDASQVPQFVNQTYVSPTPPAAPGSAAPPPPDVDQVPPPDDDDGDPGTVHRPIGKPIKTPPRKKPPG